MGKDRSVRDIAIDSVRDLLVNLLMEKNFCQARIVGKALEILVEDMNRPTIAPNVCEMPSQQRLPALGIQELAARLGTR